MASSSLGRFRALHPSPRNPQPPRTKRVQILEHTPPSMGTASGR